MNDPLSFCAWSDGSASFHEFSPEDIVLKNDENNCERRNYNCIPHYKGNVKKNQGGIQDAGQHSRCRAEFEMPGRMKKRKKRKGKKEKEGHGLVPLPLCEEVLRAAHHARMLSFLPGGCAIMTMRIRAAESFCVCRSGLRLCRRSSCAHYDARREKKQTGKVWGWSLPRPAGETGRRNAGNRKEPKATMRVSRNGNPKKNFEGKEGF